MIIVPEYINTRAELGRWGEDYVQRELQRAGYRVERIQKGNGGDLRVGELVIEVKTAIAGHDGRYRFCLTKDDKWGVTCHEASNVVILLAVNSAGLVTPFVIPCEAMTDKTSTTLPALRGYRGRYAEYRKPVMVGLRRFLQ